jgi:limonene-1,2-epoxide hydrolase
MKIIALEESFWYEKLATEGSTVAHVRVKSAVAADWQRKLVDFTEDAVYHNIPQEPVTGREDIANTIASFLRPGPPGIESIDFRVINIAANGPVVMTERVDVFKLPDKSFELPVMGTFEVSGGKINAWRDYFDMNQFTSRMG